MSGLDCSEVGISQLGEREADFWTTIESM